ncbi:hypothetical protein [Streptomyces chiangmaiensis]|uniref:MFS transporter n=1 Tax=Streptomyces chiangmaiensis TaxID=766497 RepID=A0ABU7FWX6_9ACTN|nr:hypothetical protein [Streptomyces chiangmaiensis]MED7828412.1 hypothetical protein [Streptomyces chiangmaiensis]
MLAGSVVGAVIVALDGTVLTVAQPTLQRDLWALPGPVAMVAAAPASAVRMRHHGPRRTAGTAVALLGLGVLVLSRLSQASPALWAGMGFLLVGAGFGTVTVTATAVVVREAHHIGRGGRRSAADHAERRAHGGRGRREHADDVHQRGSRAHPGGPRLRVPARCAAGSAAARPVRSPAPRRDRLRFRSGA